MNLVKLGKKGQVSIPQVLLRQLGLPPDTPLLVEATADGAILLRQVSVHPIEAYSESRLAEFAREDAMTPAQAARYKPLLGEFNARLTEAQRPRAQVHRAAEPEAAYGVASSQPATAASKAATVRAGTPKSANDSARHVKTKRKPKAGA